MSKQADKGEHEKSKKSARQKNGVFINTHATSALRNVEDDERNARKGKRRKKQTKNAPLPRDKTEKREPC